MRMGSLDEFVNSTRARIRHGDAKLVLIDDQLAPFYEAAPGDPVQVRCHHAGGDPAPAGGIANAVRSLRGVGAKTVAGATAAPH